MTTRGNDRPGEASGGHWPATPKLAKVLGQTGDGNDDGALAEIGALSNVEQKAAPAHPSTASCSKRATVQVAATTDWLNVMSTAHEVAGRVIDAINAHDIDALRGLYAADARTRRPGWPREGGTEELLASYKMDFACVPDIRFARLAAFSDGPYVATEIRITGTNTGPTVLGDFGKALLGDDVEEVPATGRPIDLPAVFMHEIRDGWVVAERQYWGLLEFLVQTGIIGG
jgi:hypothetical protein